KEMDRGLALLEDAHRDLLHAHAAALGADHELAREQILVDEAGARDLDERGAAEGLEPVGVGAAEAEAYAEHAVDHLGAHAAHERPLVARARQHLAADDEVGLVRLEDGERAAVEVGVAEIDLVAHDELAARLEDALLQRGAVVRL